MLREVLTHLKTIPRAQIENGKKCWTEIKLCSVAIPDLGAKEQKKCFFLPSHQHENIPISFPIAYKPRFAVLVYVLHIREVARYLLKGLRCPVQNEAFKFCYRAAPGVAAFFII